MKFGDSINHLNGKQKKRLLEAKTNEDLDSPVSGKKVMLSDDDLAFVSGGVDLGKCGTAGKAGRVGDKNKRGI